MAPAVGPNGTPVGPIGTQLESEAVAPLPRSVRRLASRVAGTPRAADGVAGGVVAADGVGIDGGGVDGLVLSSEVVADGVVAMDGTIRVASGAVPVAADDGRLRRAAGVVAAGCPQTHDAVAGDLVAADDGRL